jgi:signal transduction histidine kinase
MLHEFIEANREEILAQVRARAASRGGPLSVNAELNDGVPMFLAQLSDALARAATLKSVDHAEIESTAALHGGALFRQGLTVKQVVHDYGDLCQVITGLAVARTEVIDADDFRTLNLCLDDAIAGAVSAFAARRERAISDEGTERLGALVHEIRNLLNSAILAFDSLKRGSVAMSGSTSAILDRSLIGLTALVDRSFADVRLDHGEQQTEHVQVWEILEEAEISASMFAQTRGVQLLVGPTDRDLIVEVDRHLLAAAVGNLLQNAIKFTRPTTAVRLRASAAGARVFIEIEDQCGGLAPATPEDLLTPFVQRGQDRSGLGLGLSIVVKAAKAMGAELHITDLPGVGCVFTLALAWQSPPTPNDGQEPKRAMVTRVLRDVSRPSALSNSGEMGSLSGLPAFPHHSRHAREWTMIPTRRVDSTPRGSQYEGTP